MESVRLKRKWIGLSLLVLFLTGAILVACSKEPAQTEPQEMPEPVKVTPEEAEEKKLVAPLTGLPVQVPIQRRVIGVMIDNQAKARPQSGLAQADVVYEILAEGDITRYLALFHSQIPEVIGPVRSLRPYYLEIARGYDAIIVHAGGSPAAKEEVDRTGYPSLDGTRSGGPYFYRTDHRKAPHNLYTGRDKLLEGEAKFGYDQGYSLPRLLFLGEGETVAGEGAVQIEVDYLNGYRVSYEYDEEKGTYTRYVKGTVHSDEQTGEPLTFSNVLVIEADHHILDQAGRRSVDLASGGKGYLFQQGKVQEVSWQFVDGLIRPYVDGREVGLVPGKTWVNIIPDNPGLKEKVTFSAPQAAHEPPSSQEPSA